MPEILRTPIRLTCEVGLDLVHPVDRLPSGAYRQLDNARVIEEGRIDGRPGYTVYDSSASAPRLLHSVRRLNDPDLSFAAAGYTNVVGNGTILEAGIQGSLAQIDTGYSGNPLSLITFRPEASPESWMYVYDQNKLIKVRPDGATRPIGVAPPTRAPLIDYGIPATVEITAGQDATSWLAGGISTTIAAFDRPNSSGPTINAILYNSGTTGWCCINPLTPSSAFWTGERMQVILNSGGGNAETVVVRDILPAITTTTIQGIQYDSGTTGLCSIVLTGSPAGLDRNSIVDLNVELVRVLEVIYSPGGSTYSIRCSTVGTHTVGQTVAGAVSWYVYTAQAHAASETITAKALSVDQSAAGAGQALLAVALDASQANGRPIDPANDYGHISVFLQNPQNVVNLHLMLCLDDTPNFSFTNPGNSWIYTIDATSLNNQGSSGDSWVESVFSLSTGVRSGSDLTRTFAGITGIALQLTTTGACAWGFDWWYLFGTYGPEIQNNSPTGYLYQSVDRDSTTGAASVPSPVTRYQLFPLREAVIVTPQATTSPGVDSLDIYRQGGTLTSFVYDGTVANNSVTPNSYTDTLPDTSIIAAPSPDLTLLQPWPLLGLPWQGTVNVIGTTVEWVSGTHFNTALVSATVILLNGIAYTTYGQPRTTTFLELTADAGYQLGVTFLVASPTLAGQPLPYAFGPLEGPLAPVIFALGDPVSGGNLYWTNNSDGDSASDQNFLETAPPSEPLVSGQTWNGLVICGSRDNLFLVRYSYFQTSAYQFNRLPSPSGMWSRWSTARGPDGVYYVGRDGVYRANESGGANVTDALLYPLFPHDGQAATGAPGYAPVDMTQTGKQMRLSAGDFDIFFDYLDTNGTQQTMRFEIAKQRWFHHSYANPVLVHYLVDEAVTAPSLPTILMLDAANGDIYQAGGNDDNGTPIQTVVGLPYSDGGDERSQKLVTDYIVDSDQAGVVSVTQYYDNGNSNSPTSTFNNVSGARLQNIINVSSVPSILTLHRNVSTLLSWTGGPAGPRVLAVEPAWYSQPFLSTRVMTQFTPLDSPGTWIHVRRLYAGLISTSPVTFTITTQDGRVYQVVIPSTNGQFMIYTTMMPQNCKSLSMALQLDSAGVPFALFSESFTPEVKFWQEPSYINLAIFKT